MVVSGGSANSLTKPLRAKASQAIAIRTSGR